MCMGVHWRTHGRYSHCQDALWSLDRKEVLTENWTPQTQVPSEEERDHWLLSQCQQSEQTPTQECHSFKPRETLLGMKRWPKLKVLWGGQRRPGENSQLHDQYRAEERTAMGTKEDMVKTILNGRTKSDWRQIHGRYKMPFGHVTGRKPPSCTAWELDTAD
jgi:hypothetical protein